MCSRRICTAACWAALLWFASCVVVGAQNKDTAAPAETAAKRGETHLQPVKLPQLGPSQFEGERTVIKLPAACSDLVVGGGGRFLVFHLKQLRQLGVFDVMTAKVAKYLPMPSDDITFAAGANKLVVIARDQRVIQRYDLLSFEKELTRTISVSQSIAKIIMGSASNGPIFLGAGGFYENQQQLLDLGTLEPSAIELPKGRFDCSGGADCIVRASADGRVFGFCRTGTSPSGLQDLVITGNKSVVRYEHDSVGVITPSPDGRLLYTSRGIYTNELRRVGTETVSGAFPAVHGDFYLRRGSGGSVTIHLAGDVRPLLTVTGVEDTSGASGLSLRERSSRFSQLYFVPDAHVLIALPKTNDHIVLHRLDLDKALDESDVDYFFAVSRPPEEAERGETYKYTMKIKSKRGGVKYSVASGPEGMKVSSGGTVTWDVPTGSAAGERKIILAASDASGQELFQTFSLTVRGEVGADPLALEPPAASRSPSPAKAQPRTPTRTTRVAVADTNPFAPAGESDSEPADSPATAALPKVTPAQFDGYLKTVKLPAALSDVVAAGGGRYLILHLKSVRQLAVFDTSRAAIVKYLPLGSDDVSFAAGADRLFVVLRDTKIMQRWNLKTFERELSVPFPTAEPIKYVVMGSASTGPVACMIVGEHTSKCELLDPQTMQLRKLPSSAARDVLRMSSGSNFLRASADGRVFVIGGSLMIVSETSARLVGSHSSGSYGMVPNADGSVLYSPQGFFTNELKRIGTERPTGTAIPAVQPGYYISLPVSTMSIHRREGLGGVTVHVDGDRRPLVTISNVNPMLSFSSRIGSRSGTMPVDKRFWYVPEANVLVQVPATNDHLLVHKIDIQEWLDKSEIDYLFVSSRPPITANLGQEWKYQVAVKSKKGGVKYELSSAPQGMAIDSKGTIVWKVPADFDESTTRVIVAIKDASAQEVFHTFAVNIPEAAAIAKKKAEEEAARLAAEREAALRAARAEQAAAMLARLTEQGPQAKTAAEQNAMTNLLKFEEKRRGQKPMHPVRMWTDTDGNQVEAQLVEVFAGLVNLRSSKGQSFMAPMSRLSDDDRKYVKGIIAAAIAERKKLEAGADDSPQKNLRVIAMGIYSYQMARRYFPPAHTADPDGRPLLSWRVAILRYMGATELHDLFRHDEPWDSQYNRKLISLMPSFYRSPGSKAADGNTNFLGVFGDHSFFSGSKPMSPAAFRDGTTRTAAVVEVPDSLAVEWTKPEDWQYSNGDSVRKLFGFREGGFYSIFADMSVKFVSDKNSTDTISRIFTRDDGLSVELK